MTTNPSASKETRTTIYNVIYDQDGVEIFQHSAWEPTAYDMIYQMGTAIPYYGMINPDNPLDPYYADPEFSFYFDGENWAPFSNNGTLMSWLGKQTRSDADPGPLLRNAVTSTRDFISITETSKNSRVWVLSFHVTETYLNGVSARVRYDIALNANNANVDGRYDLGNGFVLIYDIKGNGSNIKELRIVSR